MTLRITEVELDNGTTISAPNANGEIVIKSQDKKTVFQIPAKDLSAALKQFAKQSKGEE